MNDVPPVPGSQDHLAEEFFIRCRRWLFRDGQQWRARESSGLQVAGDQRALTGLRLTAREVAQTLPDELRIPFCSAAHARGALRFAKADRRFQATPDEAAEIMRQEAHRRTILGPQARYMAEHFTPIPAEIQRQADAEAAADQEPDF